MKAVDIVSASLSSGYEQARTYYADVFRVALRLSGHEDQALDLTQETFKNVLQAMKRGCRLARPRAYLLTSLRNLFYRHLGRNREIAMDATDIEGYIAAHVSDEIRSFSPAGTEKLRKEIDSMDAVFRMPLQLFYFDELSYREIAQRLNVPMGTVMSRLARAKRYLKLKLSRDDAAL